MRVTHLGHACLLVETDTARLLIDPGTMSDTTGVDELDAVLVTHQHPDHLDVGRVRALLAANPRAQLVIDPDSATAVADLPARIARPGQRLTFASSTVDVLGGMHAAVYGDVPGCCTNSAYLIDDGALLHPGDSFFVPEQDVDVLAVAIDGPWLKLAEAVDYVTAVHPRVAVPIHEGETTDPGKYYGMLDKFSGGGMVRAPERGTPSTL